jgi:signal transduction histidine kinase
MQQSPSSHPAFPIRGQEQKFLEQLVKVLDQINRGLRMEEILESVFESFADLLPYDRIGFSLIESSSYTLSSYWARAKYSPLQLRKGYSAPLKGSSLERILLTGQPRIINNLEHYSQEHPSSHSTRLILSEGIRSSLTCPITRADTPIGFIFFSSCQPNTYQPSHIEAFRWISQPLALALEKAQNYERLIQLNNEKNLILGIAAHDLRSPIAQLQTMGELLQAAQINDHDRQELSSMIVARCQGMLTLLHDLLDLSAIEAGRLPLRLEQLRLAPFCQGILKGIAAIARAKQITLRLECPESLVISADPSRLSQVIDNLLTNAIKYSPARTTVLLQVIEHPQSWEIAIRDEGPGIPDGDLPKLFKPFSRTSGQPTGGEEKFGLGLSIVKKVVEAHGGEIFVESNNGNGSTFRLRLPKLKA